MKCGFAGCQNSDGPGHVDPHEFPDKPWIEARSHPDFAGEFYDPILEGISGADDVDGPRIPVTAFLFEERCDYCDKRGCHPNRHPEAVADMAAWKRESANEEFPYGDHGPESEV